MTSSPDKKIKKQTNYPPRRSHRPVVKQYPNDDMHPFDFTYEPENYKRELYSLTKSKYYVDYISPYLNIVVNDHRERKERRHAYQCIWQYLTKMCKPSLLEYVNRIVELQGIRWVTNTWEPSRPTSQHPR